jgi:metal-sulfur cluster biosynthetic enzyme
MAENKRSWVRPAKSTRPTENLTDTARPAMTTDTIVPETAPAPALAIVAESPASCSDDMAQHDHSQHNHAGGCCATTSPVAAAVAVENANAAVAALEAANHESNPFETATASSEEESTVDDAALIEALREVIDPELMINIVDLGLVYSINHTDRKVAVDMTLTSPACPAGPQIIMQSKMALEKLNGVDVAEIKLVMSPPWTPARMTDEAHDQLGIF